MNPNKNEQLMINRRSQPFSLPLNQRDLKHIPKTHSRDPARSTHSGPFRASSKDPKIPLDRIFLCFQQIFHH